MIYAPLATRFGLDRLGLEDPDYDATNENSYMEQ